MSDHRDLFDCEHPILCLPMNSVSDINLAIAVSKAGCFPSLVMTRYQRELGKVFLQKEFEDDMSRFITETGSNNMMISVIDRFVFNNYDRMIKLIEEYKISHIEMISTIDSSGHAALVAAFSKIKSLGTKIIVKTLGTPFESSIDVLFKENIISASIIKSKLGAGKTSHNRIDTHDFIIYFKKTYPNLDIIAAGGIATAEDVSRCLELGAKAVGIGTAFALSQESRIESKVKQQLIQKSSKDIELINTPKFKQNSIIFSKYDGPDNENNSKSLELGVTGSGGHVFVGHGIDHINEVLPVSEIVNRLTI